MRSRQSVGTYLQEWLEQRTDGEASLRTDAASVRLHLIPLLGDLRLRALSRERIADMAGGLRSRGLSARTVRSVLATLRRALDDARASGLIDASPAGTVTSGPDGPAPFRVLNLVESEALLDAAAQTRLHPAVLLGLEAGLRVGEVLGLAWSQVDLQRGLLEVNRILDRTRGGKSLFAPTAGPSRRSVGLSDFVLEALRAHAQAGCQDDPPGAGDAGLVLCLPSGRPWDPSNFAHAFRRLADSASFSGLRFGDLRHSHAVSLLRQGFTHRAVAVRLGFRDPQAVAANYGDYLGHPFHQP